MKQANTYHSFDPLQVPMGRLETWNLETVLIMAVLLVFFPLAFVWNWWEEHRRQQAL